MAEQRPHEKAASIYTALGWLELVIGAFLVLTVISRAMNGTAPMRPGRLVALVFPLMGWFFLKIGKGLQAREGWARTWGIVFGFLMLFGIPIGTIAGAYILINLNKGYGAPETPARTTRPVAPRK